MLPTTTPLPGTTLSGQQTTPFGAVENQSLRESVKAYNNVYRFDLLISLRDLWGDKALKYRPQLYKLVSGTCTDIELHQFLVFFYLRCMAFSNFVTREFYFGDPSIPLIRRLVVPARERINSQYDKFRAGIENAGGRLLGQDMDFMYASMPEDYRPTEGCELVD